MTIGEKIKQRRQELNMTQVELAEKLNTTKQTVGKYEHGIITNLPIYRIIQIAEVLDCEPEYLTGWDKKEELTGEELTSESMSEEDQLLLKLFHKVPEGDRKMVLNMIRAALADIE